MKWKVGLVGCGWIGGVFADAARQLPDVEVEACCAASRASAERLATAKGIPEIYDDFAELVQSEVDVVIVGVPNDLHAPVAVAALEAGKHVIIEKPLALNLEAAEEIAAVAARCDRLVGYAENLCFAPKYREAKRLATDGTLGEVRFLKQVEKHEGPHSPWFLDRERAGGGALFDMGCHSIEFARWFFDKTPVTAVWATMDTWLHRPGVHPDITDLEDHVVVHLEFEGGATALLESGWCLKGGMVSRTEVQGTGGVLHSDLLQEGMGMRLFSDRNDEAGWRHVDSDWCHQNGYPQELAHFLTCFERGEVPEESVGDGIAVMEILLAAYYSAGTGRKIHLPFRPPGIQYPVDLWKAPPPHLDQASKPR